MNNSRNKLLKTMMSLALVAVLAVGSVVAVVAALNATVTSGFNISYVAHNVHARVIGQYKQGAGSKGSLGADLVFTGDEAQDGVANTKGFDTKNFTLTGPDDVVEIYYAILNTSAEEDMGFGVEMDITGLNITNFDVKYSFQYFQWPVDEDKEGGDYLKGAPEADFSLTEKPTKIYLKPKGDPKSCALIGMQFKVNNVVQRADVNGSVKFDLDSTVEAPMELFNSKTKQFNTKYFNLILQKITGENTTSVSNLAKLDEMATAENAYNIAGSDAENFRNNNNGEDIIVTLGGLTWNVCYLSKDTQGNIILTLWLTSSQQKFFEGMSATEGEFYGYLDGSLYSDWSANWSGPSTSLSYLSSMYGTSYIRAVTLNNGGEYVTIGGENLLSYTKNKESLFALFTVEDLGLTDYIVKPKDVEWQESGQLAKDIINYSYNLPNENWSSDLEKVPDTGFYDSRFNYAHKGEYNSAWANDYLWLPSMSETGYNSGTHGLWQLDVAQRKNGSFSSTSSVGNVGQTSGAAYNHSWLRSGDYNTANTSNSLTPSGSAYYGNSVNRSCAVRPALHLNLTAAARALNA